MRTDFAAFILTHGRANNCPTYHSLRRGGYTGRIVVLIDDLDQQRKQYEANFPGEVVVFDKKAAVSRTDACDNYGKHNSVVFARNEVFRIARDMGLKWMVQLDDDYTQWGFKMDSSRHYLSREIMITHLDRVFESVLRFMESAPQVLTLAFAQGGDFIGGAGNPIYEKGFTTPLLRKAMNTFFFRVNDSPTFRGRVNDDVNLSLEYGQRGAVCFTMPMIRIWQAATQEAAGGCTDIYREFGTYIKSFYSVLLAPASVTIRLMGEKHQRLHHHVKWSQAVPKIIDERYRKERKVLEPETSEADHG